MKWNKTNHSAYQTNHFVFNQLIPYIGNKRKLLDLIAFSLEKTEINPKQGLFIDCFSGTGVVSRLAKTLGYQVFANDWEPYSEILNIASIQNSVPPLYFNNQPYHEVLRELNNLLPIQDWITNHLCPDDDINYDLTQDRLFYMRKNGMRIDAIREKISEWERKGMLDKNQLACLLAPVLYCACYHSNTSGVFKGFHKGWGGQTKTALYRIAGDLRLNPIQFIDNHRDNQVFKLDAQLFAEQLRTMKLPDHTIAYLDPPYNQHPYGANYHVLNSITLWDKPEISKKISFKEKSAIRQDWRIDRKSAYTIRKQACQAYTKLIQTLPTEWIATSYSTDGFISLDDMIQQNCLIGQVFVFAKQYKRYRVSSQRYSHKANNVEIVLLTKKGKLEKQSAEEIVEKIRSLEKPLPPSTYQKINDTIYCF